MILGQRVRLRAVERGDLPRFVEWLNDGDVIQNLGIYVPLSIAQEEEWYSSMQKLPVEEHSLAIDALQDDAWGLIGNMSLMNLDHHNRSAELGIFIGNKDYWGKGYGDDALRLMLRHGFKNLNLNRIFLRVFEPNQRAIRCYEKVGFIHEGRMRQAQYTNGKYVDTLYMSILRDEWQDLEV